MAFLLDTSVAIDLRDQSAGLTHPIANLRAPLFLSAISRAELEGGVVAVSELSDVRRARLDVLLATLDVIDFTNEMATIYGQILSKTGFSRRKIIDRMIAATALVTDLTLITANGDDFEDIEGLKLEILKK